MVIVLTATLDLREAIGFSGVTILTYYAITNAACLTLRGVNVGGLDGSRVLGLGGCVTFAVMLPVAAIIAGVGVLLVGLAIRRFVPASVEPSTH